jgi:hypothetical protein
MGFIKSQLIVLLFMLLFSGCNSEKTLNIIKEDHMPEIWPDYKGITIPVNIAPLNFSINEPGRSFIVIASSGNGNFSAKILTNETVRFPEKIWRKLILESKDDSINVNIFSVESGIKKEFTPFSIKITKDLIDPYLVYRKIYPGYYSWSDIKIRQRSTESFEEESVIENRILDKNCANCHSFNNNNPQKFMVHVRGSLGGTYFVEDEKITRIDPKTDAMPGGATYPSWHPGGRFVAFSSNQVRQSFYSQPPHNIEVFDLVSSLVLYDRNTNQTFQITDNDSTKHLQTFPSWSPDGKYIYYCSAPSLISMDNPELGQIKNTHYDLVRREFNSAAGTFGDAEVVFKASDMNKSVSFPRISPDGNFLVFTMADYGTFPIWHREADLYLIDLRNRITKRMDVNSNETDSFHSWSSNSKWLVFSSKREDGRTTRPYFVHIDSSGRQSKPFILPQKDPTLYGRMLESFNIPEFVTGKILIRPRDFEKASRLAAVKAKAGGSSDQNKRKPSGNIKPMKAVEAVEPL